MLFVYISLCLIIGIWIGHFIFPKTVVKTETVFKEVKVPTEPIITRPDDYEDYLKWKEHKDDWVDLKNMIADIEIQDDDKFERIMQIIDKELRTTEGGEFGGRTVPKRKKK